MAGYYDPNKDYSKAISEAKAAGKDTSQLEAERQNKIKAKYGGKEPTMYGSNKTYSQAIRDNDSDTISNAISISNSRGRNSSNFGSGGRSGGSTDLVKGPGYVTGGYTMGVNGSPILNDNPYWKGGVSASKADMSRRPDLANGYATSNGYTVFYDEDGYATKAIKGVADYTPHQDLNAENGSYGKSGAWTDNEMLTAADRQKIADIRAGIGTKYTGDQANQLANQIRSGYGYTIDKNGMVTDLGAKSAVDARRRAWGLPTDGGSAEQQNYLQLMFPELGTNDMDTLLGARLSLGQGTYGKSGGSQPGGYQADGLGSGYLSFEDFLAGTGYDQYADATQAAIRAAVQNAVNGYRDQIDTTNQDSDELARQAYIAKMMGQKNLDQQMAANGYAGGMADSQRIATETDYQNQLSEIEKQRLATVKELESAITNAQLTGDMQTAQELADYLQNIQSQWMNYVQNQQQMDQQNYWNQQNLDNQNYWNQQNLNAQNTESARSWAMQQIAMGIMPDDETLTAAGISKQAAQQQVALNLGQTGGGTVTKPAQQAARRTTGGGYNNGSLTSSQVMELQKALGVTADGLWGSNSSAAAGGMTADQAWAAYQGQNNGNRSPSYSDIKRTIQTLMSQGNKQRAQDVLDQFWDTMTETQQLEMKKLYG